MNTFRRVFYNSNKQETRIMALQNEPAFTYLMADVASGEIFPALRENVIDFYYMGARLCHYAAGKMAWHKNEPYPSDNGDYKSIKKKCVEWGTRKNGSFNERATLSALYRDKGFSPYMSDQSNMILLDMEVGFPCLSIEGKSIQNVQVDLLFLDLDTNTLFFIEAKEADDPRIKVVPDKNESETSLYKRLEVSEQIMKYEANLNYKKREQEIISAYSDYINVMNQIFHCKIQKKQLSLYPRPKLFVYGESTPNGKICLNALRFTLGDDLITKSEARYLQKKDIVK